MAKWFPYLVMFCVSLHGLAQGDTVVVFSHDDHIALKRHALFFVDTTGSLTFDQVEEEFAKGNFSSAGHDVPNFTGVRGAIWFRIAINKRIPDPLYLFINNLYVEQIDLYSALAGSPRPIAVSGFLRPFYSRDFPSNRYILRVMSAYEREAVIFGRLASTSSPPMHLPMSIGSLEAIVETSRYSEFISIAVLGLLLVMLFYNLSLFIVLRDRFYFAYCVYILSAIITVLWFSGFLFEWFWPFHPENNPFPWQMTTFHLAQLAFINMLLQVKKNLPLNFRVSLVFYGMLIAGFLCGVFQLPLQMPLVLLTAMLLSLYFLVTSLQLFHSAHGMATIFLLGWTPLLIITVMNILMVMDVVAYSPLIDTHAVELSIAWEMVIFSLALGYRFNTIRQEKEQLQSENLTMVKEQKALLRKMVFEQTEEIIAQNDQLLRHQEEITLQNERLEAQNRAYERLKEMILKQNQELEKSVEKRTLQLARSNEELKRHFHQLEQFSFIAAHNLRAPVARILGLASLLDRGNLANPDNLSLMEKILLSAKDLDMIIHDLGAILDTQKSLSLKAELVSIRDLVQKIVARFEADIQKHGIVIEANLQVDSIVAIPAYLDSILTNLISNSVKYRADKGVAAISVFVRIIDREILISVEDNGIGFDSKQLERKLFEPFQRFHTHVDGKGLGMFLVKTQVVAMNGSIEVESVPFKGTKVLVRLPKLPIPEMAG